MKVLIFSSSLVLLLDFKREEGKARKYQLESHKVTLKKNSQLVVTNLTFCPFSLPAELYPTGPLNLQA